MHTHSYTARAHTHTHTHTHKHTHTHTVCLVCGQVDTMFHELVQTYVEREAQGNEELRRARESALRTLKKNRRLYQAYRSLRSPSLPTSLRSPSLPTSLAPSAPPSLSPTHPSLPLSLPPSLPPSLPLSLSSLLSLTLIRHQVKEGLIPDPKP
jgi:hypothetical protein